MKSNLFHSLSLPTFTSVDPDRYQSMDRSTAAAAAVDLELGDSGSNLGVELAVAGKQSADTAAAAENTAAYLRAGDLQEVSNVVGAAAEGIDHTPGFGTAAAFHIHIATERNLVFAKTDQGFARTDQGSMRIALAFAATAQVYSSAAWGHYKTVVWMGELGCAAVVVLLHAGPQCYCSLDGYPSFLARALRSHQ